MILTISGLHGTGKSTIGKKLAEILKIRFYSTGEAFRELAKEMKMNLQKFTEFVEKHPEIDKKLDEKIIKIAEKGDVIIDGQLSGFILKNLADFKILLQCPLKTRVKRMADRDNSTYKEKLKETKFREFSELKRFKDLYNIDLKDKKNIHKTYDLILNTKNLSVEDSVNKIISELKIKNYF
ncbi:MAG: (d)CMP kinase [Promethearchaeota archaeon]